MEEAWRLHRVALKQAANDPTSGRVISIPTTDIPAAGRERRQEVAASLTQEDNQVAGLGTDGGLHQTLPGDPRTVRHYDHPRDVREHHQGPAGR